MEGRATEVLDRYRAAMSELVDLDLDGWSDAEIVELWTGLEVESRRASVLDQDLIEQLETRSLPHTHGYPSTKAMAIDLLHVSPAEAHVRVHASRRFGPQRAITGEVVDRIYPTVTAAQMSGEISAAHAKVIADTIEHLPHEIATLHDREIEATLTADAAVLDPRSLGIAILKGEATPEVAEYLQVMLAAYDKPKPDTTDPDTGTVEQDLRSPSQRPPNNDAWPCGLGTKTRSPGTGRTVSNRSTTPTPTTSPTTPQADPPPSPTACSSAAGTTPTCSPSAGRPPPSTASPTGDHHHTNANDDLGAARAPEHVRPGVGSATRSPRAWQGMIGA